MKIIQFFTFPVMCCCLLGIPVAKAQPAPTPTCVQQCQAFCAGIVANFTPDGSGALSTESINVFLNALPPSGYRQVTTPLNNLMRARALGYHESGIGAILQNILQNCQSHLDEYCSQGCASAQKPTHAPKMTVPSQ